METWLPWQPWKPSLENFYSGTGWEPLLGKLGNLYLEILGLCTWQLGILYLGTFWALQESVLGNLGDLHLGAFTRNCCGNLHSVTLATLGSLWNLYLGTLREPLPWEPWKPVLGNLYLGTLETFAWELLLGNLWTRLLRNLYVGTRQTFTWEPLGPS